MLSVLTSRDTTQVAAPADDPDDEFAALMARQTSLARKLEGDLDRLRRELSDLPRPPPQSRALPVAASRWQSYYG